MSKNKAKYLKEKKGLKVKLNYSPPLKKRGKYEWKGGGSRQRI